MKILWEIKLYNKSGNIIEIMVASTKDKANRVALYWCNRTYKRTEVVRTKVVRSIKS